MVRQRRRLRFNLCEDILLMVFKTYLRITDLLACACVSKQWNILANRTLSGISAAVISVRLLPVPNLTTYGYEIRFTERRGVEIARIHYLARVNERQCTDDEWKQHVNKYKHRLFTFLYSLVFRLKHVADLELWNMDPEEENKNILDDAVRLLSFARKTPRFEVGEMVCHAVETFQLDYLLPKKLFVRPVYEEYTYKEKDVKPMTAHLSQMMSQVDSIQLEHNVGKILTREFLKTTKTTNLMAEVTTEQMNADTLIEMVQAWQSGLRCIEQYMFCVKITNELENNPDSLFKRLTSGLENCNEIEDPLENSSENPLNSRCIRIQNLPMTSSLYLRFSSSSHWMNRVLHHKTIRGLRTFIEISPQLSGKFRNASRFPNARSWRLLSEL